ncbi:MAG: glycosyl hydrolase family 8 [Steroidobacteraceae bacterium]
MFRQKSRKRSNSSSTAMGQEQRVYFETGANANGTLAYITDWANNDARTEGMSYGMMIAVQLNKKREFDALWNWSHTNMLITDPQDPSVGYFAWSMNTDGTAPFDWRRPRWRGVLRHGAVFRGASLGQWPRHLQLSGAG